MFKKYLTLAISTASFIFLFGYSANALEMKVYYEDSDSFPFSMKNGSGTDIILIKSAAQKNGINIQFIAVPWERCLYSIQSGEGDGCFSASFKTERLDKGDYPMNDGKPDEGRRLHTTSFSFFVKTEDLGKYKVNGMEISGIDKKTDSIGAVLGYSIVDDLKKAGYSIDDGSVKSELNFKKLAAGRIKGLATLTQEGEFMISTHDYKGKLAKVEPPLVSKAYYLMLSKQFVSKNKDLAEKLWSTIAEVRESAEYKKQSEDFIAAANK